MAHLSTAGASFFPAAEQQPGIAKVPVALEAVEALEGELEELPGLSGQVQAQVRSEQSRVFSPACRWGWGGYPPDLYPGLPLDRCTFYYRALTTMYRLEYLSIVCHSNRISVIPPLGMTLRGLSALGSTYNAYYVVNYRVLCTMRTHTILHSTRVEYTGVLLVLPYSSTLLFSRALSTHVQSTHCTLPLCLPLCPSLRGARSIYSYYVRYMDMYCIYLLYSVYLLYSMYSIVCLPFSFAPCAHRLPGSPSIPLLTPATNATPCTGRRTSKAYKT